MPRQRCCADGVADVTWRVGVEEMVSSYGGDTHMDDVGVNVVDFV